MVWSMPVLYIEASLCVVPYILKLLFNFLDFFIFECCFLFGIYFSVLSHQKSVSKDCLLFVYNKYLDD